MLALVGAAHAAALPAAPVLVAGPVDDRATVSLPGDLSSRVRAATDAGALADSTPLPHIRLELKRPAALQQALDRLVHDQQVKGSASYHRWISPADLRAYGPAQADIDKVAGWLTGHGLTLNSVSRSGMSIDFGGSAGAVARAFHTSLHRLSLRGETHVANISPPAIPQALTPVVTGVTLHNFFPKPAMRRLNPKYTAPTPYGTYYAVAPADFETIYNIKPLWSGANEFGQPITGAGVTIAVVEQTEILPFDWNTFRKTFGLSGYAGTLTLVHPGNCTNPHYTGDEGEAALDAEWSSSPAPDAAILEASCATAPPLDFGVETALQNLVEQPTPATIFSISYGGSELSNGFSFEQGWTNLVEEGAAEGKAIFVSSGDSGASADEGIVDEEGLAVNGLSDSAYVTSVGGTDFLDTSLNENATYWKSANGPSGSSAKSYVPETPWNNGCASSVLFRFEGYSGATAYCNSPPQDFWENNVGGSGGQSVYYAKPDWQITSIPGMPNDGLRDQPDVSLFAANGLWSHFYILCMSDANEGGSPCHYHNVNDLFGNAAGGTSFAAPAFAGIAALVQQGEALFGATGGLGNPAPTLYTIAQAQFANPLALTPCDSTLGNAISTICAFNIVTDGNNSGPCAPGTANCAPASSPNPVGVLVNPSVEGGPAFHAHLGYSLAVGLGTVNVTNLLYNYVDTN
jgi:subtilase family serine protease